MAAISKISSLTHYGRETQNQESRNCFALGLRISELPGAAFAAITLFYVVAELAKLAW
ncbi:MAG TPA: hypothetical protein VMA09_04830 [Candidatus Binataceae bacterium]|nr:hypothetical protein [Candidatus Binataceae bacterium]